MSVSEQEAKQQIAQMRQALVSMKVSARRASYVRIVGVIVGFGIVGIYVYLFLHLLAVVAHSKQFRPLVMQRIQTLQLQQKAVKVVEGALPVYLKEGRKMISNMDLTPVEKQGAALLQDLRPLLLSEADRVWPKLQDALIVQGNQGAKQLEDKLRTELDSRLQAIVKKHSSQIQSQTGLTEAQTAQVMHNIVGAGQEAMLSMLNKRWGQNEEKLKAIAGLVDKLPALPPMSEKDMYESLGRTLVALAKIKLPDYDVEKVLGQPLVSKTAAPVVARQPHPSAKKPAPKTAAAAHRGPSAAERVKILEQQLKRSDLTDEQRQNIQKQLDKEKAAMSNTSSAH